MPIKYSIEDFDILRIVGKGYMGKVMVVRGRHNGEIYAIKSIHKKAILEKKEMNHTRSERDILAHLMQKGTQGKDIDRNKFLIQLHAAFQDAANVYYLMDFHGGGDLAGLLSQMIRLPDRWCRLYAAEIVSGLIDLHKQNIIYRDLKPENILISKEGHIVLTDFGLSRLVDDGSMARTFCGTPEYLAPEVIMRLPYGKSVDWWGLGALLYEMYVGITPFWHEVPSQMYSLIACGTKIPEYPPSVPRDARELINSLLERDPTRRISDDAIKDHSYFWNINWDRLNKLEYPAPFIPSLNSSIDVNAFDPAFTTMPPIITPDSSIRNNNNNGCIYDHAAFRDFTYRPDITK